jgi:hypothetical protein
VLAHGRFRLLRVALLDRRDHVEVLLQAAGHPPGDDRRAEEVAGAAVAQPPDHALGGPLRGGRVDAAVDLLADPFVADDVAVLDGRLHLPGQRAQLLADGRRDAFGGLARAHALDDGADLDRLDRLVQRHRPDRRAAVPLPGDVPLGLQQHQGVADGAASGGERLDELDLDQAVPGGEGAVQDRLPQLVGETSRLTLGVRTREAHGSIEPSTL